MGLWGARAHGLTAGDAAAAVGVSRATLYRWEKPSRRNRLEPRSRRPGTARPLSHEGQGQEIAACDLVAKRTCAQAWRRADAHNAKRFLDKRQADMPFPVRAMSGRWRLRVQGRLRARMPQPMDRRLRRRVQHLPTAQALDGQTPAHCPQSPTAKETPTPHMP